MTTNVTNRYRARLLATFVADPQSVDDAEFQVIDEILAAGGDASVWPVYRELFALNDPPVDRLELTWSVVDPYVRRAKSEFGLQLAEDAIHSPVVATYLLDAIELDIASVAPWLALAVSDSVALSLDFDAGYRRERAVRTFEALGCDLRNSHAIDAVEKAMLVHPAAAWCALRREAAEKAPDRRRETFQAWAEGMDAVATAGSAPALDAVGVADRVSVLLEDESEAGLCAFLNMNGYRFRAWILQQLKADNDFGYWMRGRALHLLAAPWHGEPSPALRWVVEWALRGHSRDTRAAQSLGTE